MLQVLLEQRPFPNQPTPICYLGAATDSGEAPITWQVQPNAVMSVLSSAR